MPRGAVQSAAVPAKHTAAEPRPRIVSLAPSATSILWAIGARREVAGVTKWCADVAPVGRLPRVGDCWAADPAAIAQLRPTLLVGSVPFKPEMVARLLELGVPLLALNPRSLSDIYADIHLLGRIASRAGAAASVVRSMQRALAQISACAARRGKSKIPGRPPRVYCEAWPNPRISSPPWVAEVVRIAGGDAVLPAGEKVTDEQVAAAAPEVIVLAWAAAGSKSDPRKALENSAWRHVPAVRAGRVHAMRDELLNTPAPILVRGAQELAKLIGKARVGQ
jgi:iron complex transport system substrate-binding protein